MTILIRSGQKKKNQKRCNPKPKNSWKKKRIQRNIQNNAYKRLCARTHADTYTIIYQWEYAHTFEYEVMLNEAVLWGFTTSELKTLSSPCLTVWHSRTIRRTNEHIGIYSSQEKN